MSSILPDRPAGADESSLLLIKPGSMGDVIHALPVAAAVHRARPDLKLAWIVDPRWASLLDGNAGVARLHFFPREKFRGPLGWMRAMRWYAGLSVLRPDVVVDLQGLMRSALMARLSGGRKIIGLSDAREGAGSFYHASATTHTEEHAVNRYLHCLPLLGIPEPENAEFILPPGTPPDLEPGYIVLHPFSRGAGKSMDAGAIAAFVAEFQFISRRKIVIAGVGNPTDGLPRDVLDVAGKTSLPEFIGLLRGASFVVSVDSGPMHLAAAMGIPLLGIHTWSDPRLVGPYSKTAWIWQGGEIRAQDFKKPPLAERPFASESARGVARFVASKTH